MIIFSPKHNPSVAADLPNVKIRKAGTNGSVVALLIDSSSSMLTKWSETVIAAREFVKANAEDTISTKMFIALFNGRSNLKIISNFQDAKDINTYQMLPERPDGSTDLNDAIALTLKEISDKVLKDVRKKDRPSVQVIILTDGEENCSRLFKQSDIREFIETAEDKNWAFDFIGCDFSVDQAGLAYGFSSARTMSYDSTDTAGAFRNIIATTSATKAALSAGATVDVIYRDVKYDQNKE